MSSTHARIGIIGAGFVGAAVASLLGDESRQAALLDASTVPMEVAGIAVRDVTRERPELAAHWWRGSVNELLTRDLDVLVEVAGDPDVMALVVDSALRSGMSVVTANKALMARHGTQLAQTAHAAGVDLFYEASVAGGIPIIRALRTSLAGERVSRLMGIVNGTTNFILSTMTQSGSDYQSALADAQRLGYAEADPTADVEGFDAAAKLVILSSLAFGTAMDGLSISTSGITTIRDGDIRFVSKMGYVIKLIAVAQRVGENRLARYVGPTLVPASHPLAAINGAMNAVMVEGDKSGPLVWSGRGAGGEPTATAVLGDVIEAVRNKAAGRHDVPFSVDPSIELMATAEVSSRFYLSLDVFDRPGVLAQVANVFGEFGISIQSMEQVGVGDEAQLFFITHEATTAAIDHTMASLAHLSAVGRVGCCLRLLATEESA